MRISKDICVPHPFPYQGSKRSIAKDILPYFPCDIDCLVEPFCGAAAVSIAAMAHGFVDNVVLNDSNEPLMDLWREILERPEQLCDEYERHWFKQQDDKKKYFLAVRDDFNETHQPQHLLYLLARIVKGSVRYSSSGNFNQSADNRRSGMKPNTMRQNIYGVSTLLKGRTVLKSSDFRDVVKNTSEASLVYMDPPYQGTSFTRDHRYYSGLSYDEFVDALYYMNRRNVSFIISYDGTTGDKTYGKRLPEGLSLEHLEIQAGRSSQATLLGKSYETTESLYLSPSLVERLQQQNNFAPVSRQSAQEELAFG